MFCGVFELSLWVFFYHSGQLHPHLSTGLPFCPRAGDGVQGQVFHQLPEFDQGKRSCRRRLAGHNERRRKPPPSALSSSIGLPYSSFNVDNSSRLGGFLVNFACPQLSGSSVWTATTRAGGRVTSKQWQGGTELPVSENQGSDPPCALSLLSTFTEDRAPATTTIATRSFSVSSNNSFGVSPAMSSSDIETSSWGFKGREAVEPMQLSSELELALRRKRLCMELDDMLKQSM